jgi:hypothetical protein
MDSAVRATRLAHCRMCKPYSLEGDPNGLSGRSADKVPRPLAQLEGLLATGDQYQRPEDKLIGRTVSAAALLKDIRRGTMQDHSCEDTRGVCS